MMQSVIKFTTFHSYRTFLILNCIKITLLVQKLQQFWDFAYWLSCIGKGLPSTGLSRLVNRHGVAVSALQKAWSLIVLTDQEGNDWVILFLKYLQNTFLVQKLQQFQDFAYWWSGIGKGLPSTGLSCPINWPSVARAVLQTAWSLIVLTDSRSKWLSHPFSKISSKHLHTQAIRSRELKF